MYNVSEAYRRAIRQPGRALRSRFTFVNADKVIDDNNIVTFTYNDDIIAKDDFEIGTAIMSTLTCELLYTQELEGSFENKEIKLEVGIELEDKSFEYVPVGLYTIEKPEYSGKKISLKGIDRMYKFEKDYVTNLTYPTTLLKIAQEVCQQAGVELVNTSFPNSGYTINYPPVLENVTLRKAISQIAELAGGYARITRDGKLEIFNLVTGFNMTKYANNTDFYTEDRPILLSDEGGYREQGFIRSIQLTKDNYINLTSKELELAQINKVVVKLGAEEAVKGDGNNPYYVVDNMFCQDPSKVVKNLYNVLNGLSYLPLQSKWQGDPSLDCGDLVDVYITDDQYALSLFTNRTVTYKGGLREEVQAVGKSDTERNSTSKGSMTLDMKKALTEIKVLDGEISQRVKTDEFESYAEQTAEEFTQKVSRGEDLETEVKQNAESWTLSIGGKLEGAKYKFDGDGFTIGDTAEHTPTYSKWKHGDGSYSQASADGFKRHIAGEAQAYQHITLVGLEILEVTENGPTTKVITLPSYFKGKNYKVSSALSEFKTSTADYEIDSQTCKSGVDDTMRANGQFYLTASLWGMPKDTVYAKLTDGQTGSTVYNHVRVYAVPRWLRGTVTLQYTVTL